MSQKRHFFIGTASFNKAGVFHANTFVPYLVGNPWDNDKIMPMTLSKSEDINTVKEEHNIPVAFIHEQVPFNKGTRLSIFARESLSREDKAIVEKITEERGVPLIYI